MIDQNIRPHRNISGRKSRPNCTLPLRIPGCVALFTLLFTGCGGGGSSSPSSSSTNPVPSLYSISPTSAPAGGRAIAITVTGGNFISGAQVKWNGSSRTTTYVSNTQLTAVLTPTDLASAGSGQVTVFNPTPGGGTSSSLSFTISSVSALSLITTQLPDAARNKEYFYTLQANGGITPYTWTLLTGSLPPGLSLSSDGVISGTPDAVSQDTTFNIAVQLSDNAYQANTLTKSYSILSRASKLARNDTCPNATPISNGVIRASISPFGDIDVYSFHGNAGDRITAEIYAQRLTLYSGSTTTDDFLDSFLELLDSSCFSIYYNDDISSGVITDSKLSDYTLPSTGTYYLRVSDLRGDGRPDFIYELHLSGAD